MHDGPASGTAPAPAAARRPHPARLLAALLCAGTLVALSVLLLGGDDPAAPEAASLDAPRVLEELHSLRETAFGLNSEELLAQVYAPGSAELARDVAALRAQYAVRRTARWVRRGVRSLQVLSSSARAARVRLVADVPAYDVVDSSGRAVRRVPAEGRRAWELELVRTAQGWRIAAERPA